MQLLRICGIGDEYVKELLFRIDKYSFSNNIVNLKNYLDKLEIEYNIKNDMIEF